MDKFLKVPKSYFGIGLQSIDVLILSQIAEFNSNGLECHMTNAQFMEMLGESEHKIQRSINKLVSMGLVSRETKSGKVNGSPKKYRKMNIVESGIGSLSEDASRKDSKKTAEENDISKTISFLKEEMGIDTDESEIRRMTNSFKDESGVCPWKPQDLIKYRSIYEEGDSFIEYVNRIVIAKAEEEAEE